MGIFCQRWLALYKTKAGPAAKIIVDSECQFPFGVDEEMVAEDCREIIAFVGLPDDYVPHTVAIGDREVEVQQPEGEG